MSSEPSPTPAPARRRRGRAAAPEQPRRRFRIPWWWIGVVIAALVINQWAASRVTEPATRIRVPYSPFFVQQVKDKNVKDITSKGTAIQGSFKQPTAYKGSKPTTNFKTEIPAFANTDQLSALLQSNGVVVNAVPLDTGAPLWESLLVGFGPTLLFLALLFLFLRRAGACRTCSATSAARGRALRAVGRAGDVRGRRRHRRGEGGADRGGRLPAQPGEVPAPRRAHPARRAAHRPARHRQDAARSRGRRRGERAFFSIAASEFVEAIVGVGASRVRDLFEQAKKVGQAIIFIDELDAVGGSRTSGAAGFSGGNDEREQTLNQILTEMDGFDPSTGVIVIGATNRPDVLDQALLRPGPLRPPRRRPAARPRRARGDPARCTPAASRSRPTSTSAGSPRPRPGMVGADLANLVNEAALLAARREPRPGQRVRLRRRARADRARRRAQGDDVPRRTAAGRPTTRAATRSSGCSRPAPTRSGRSRSSRAGWRSA